MGVYIKGMEMPEHCGDCRFAADGWCYVIPETHRQPKLDYIARPDWCPLIEVPPHGDLIDRNALVRDNGIKEIPEYYEVVRDAPTIVPADESNMDSFIRIFEEDDEEDGMDSFIRILKD